MNHKNKMKVAYFDCFSGISGDMVLGALIHLGLDVSLLQERLEGLNIGDFNIRASDVRRGELGGVKVEIEHDKGHAVSMRTLKDITSLIDDSSLDDKVKELGKSVFKKLAVAESKAHGTSLDYVHFHEVGALDSIVDILGTCIGVVEMGWEHIKCSALPFNRGIIRSGGMSYPNPAPATLELLQEFDVYPHPGEEEMVTPTGAAILATLCGSSSMIPKMVIRKTGYGAGDREGISLPNLLRIITGELIPDMHGWEEVCVLEANMDDMNPLFYQSLINELFAHGALDVSLTPIYMKRNRPATSLKIICGVEKRDILMDVLFENSTTLGVRCQDTLRLSLDRKEEVMETEDGPVRIKITYKNGRLHSVSPEPQDCLNIAQKKNQPMSRVYEDIRVRASNKWQ